MLSLRWKLALALLLVVAVSAGLTAWLGHYRSTREFRGYVLESSEHYQEKVVTILTGYYTAEGSWDNVQSILDDQLLPDAVRVVVVNESGVVVGDTADMWLGETAAAVGLTDPFAVIASVEDPAELHLMSSWEGSEPGFRPGGPAPGGPPLAAPEGDYLSRINRSLLIAGSVGAVVAILLGLILTRQFTRPIEALKKGAARIAHGDLSYRVNVESRDEFGDLAGSFNSMAASLEDSEQARRRLFADIAHELKTPLSVIEGTVDAMLDGVYETNTGNLASIKEETAALTVLVADLRDLALAESGQLRLEFEPTHLADLVQKQVSLAGVAARERNVALTTDMATDLPLVEVDPRRVEQVVANLLDNALKHTPAGGTITVSVAVSAELDERLAGLGHIRVSVADTGEGIPAGHLPHVFERFYRVDEARARKGGGAGLGLAIARQMVDLHGGRIWVESEMGNGTRFAFTLPLVRRA